MYEEYWELREKPFRNTPDPRFLYHSSQHEDALMKLIYTINEGMGAGMMTGVFGCGKTLLGRALLKDLGPEKYKVAFITNPVVSSTELLRAIVRNLKAASLPTKQTELLADPLLENLNEIFMNNLRDGKETVIIIDEAHSIQDEKIFEELRLLLNFQLEDRFLFTLLLFGQPELKEKVANLKQLEQRIAIRCHLDRLNEEDTEKYILHRLKVAGKAESIFTKEAIKLIFEQTGGIPRRINHLCDLCLLTGYGKRVKEIDEKLLKEAAEKFA
ncbi:MAG: AAA family ATPase [Candidatus Omnitrophica bacterium]|nr:AAA family ATPase [Candidatus Omnitrophota bacterium]